MEINYKESDSIIDEVCLFQENEIVKKYKDYEALIENKLKSWLISNFGVEQDFSFLVYARHKEIHIFNDNIEKAIEYALKNKIKLYLNKKNFDFYTSWFYLKEIKVYWNHEKIEFGYLEDEIEEDYCPSLRRNINREEVCHGA